jgi:histidinol-phosphate aminotransferase
LARPSKLRSCLRSLRPYVAGKGYVEISRKYGLRTDDIIKLGSNENPYGPSPKVLSAIKSVSPERYPEPEELIEALSDYTGYPAEMIIIGAGMDGIMDTITRLFLDAGDRAFIPIPTFSYYEILTELCGAQPYFSTRGAGFDVSEDIPRDVKMAFICSPNNPTGNATPEEDVRRMVEETEGIVFLDEAYADFADTDIMRQAGDYDNLVVGRTMSKAFGLAGMRLGYAVAPEWIADEYRRAAPPFFGITCASVAAGVAALSDLSHMRRSVSMIRSERERLHREIGSHPSQANFLYIETVQPSNEVAERFMQKGIIIRDCRSFRGAGEHHIRLTVGTPEQNDRFLDAYKNICG